MNIQNIADHQEARQALSPACALLEQSYEGLSGELTSDNLQRFAAQLRQAASFLERVAQEVLCAQA
jgi:hypothetical protein